MNYSLQSLLLLLSVCLIFLTVPNEGQPVLMTEDIGEEIFHNNKYYLIYVYREPTQAVWQMFDQYCQGKTTCAVLNSTVEQFESVTDFIGKEGDEFFLILNVPFQKKYILEVDTESLTKNDLRNFEKRYEAGTLSPFYASDPEPEQTSAYYTEIVGKTFDSFLRRPAILKVVYSYTKHEECEGCMYLLKDFLRLSEDMSNDQVLIFGYVDIFHNDIPSISEPIVPHFYIYRGDQVVAEVGEADFDDLPKIIKKQVKNIIQNARSQLDSEALGGDDSSSDESESANSETGAQNASVSDSDQSEDTQSKDEL